MGSSGKPCAQRAGLSLFSSLAVSNLAVSNFAAAQSRRGRCAKSYAKRYAKDDVRSCGNAEETLAEETLAE